MTYQLTFPCREPGCHETATMHFYETSETEEELRRRNPLIEIAIEVLCDARHSGSYLASRAVEIRSVPPPQISASFPVNRK
jgi:hypothetical protein